LAIRFLPTCTWGASTVAFPHLLFKTTQTNQEPAFYTAASLIVAAFAQVLTGRLCDRLGLRWPVRLAAVALTLSCFLAALFADTRLGLWTCGIAVSASAWSLSTTMPALMSTMIEPHEKGRIVGAAHLAWAMGMGLGKYGGGLLLKIGPSAVYFAGCLFCVGAVVCAWAIVRPQTGPDDAGEPL
jgi:MFS family permease